MSEFSSTQPTMPLSSWTADTVPSAFWFIGTSITSSEILTASSVTSFMTSELYVSSYKVKKGLVLDYNLGVKKSLIMAKNTY